MQISFVLPKFPHYPVGGLKVIYEYANRLVGRGHELTLVHTSQFHPGDRNLWHPRSLISRAARVARGWTRPPETVDWFDVDDRVDVRYVSRLEPDAFPEADSVVVTAWWNVQTIYGLPARKGQPVYLIQAYEVWNGPEEAVNATWRLPLPKVVIAKWLYEKGLSLGVPEDELFYVPNGIDHETFRLVRPIEDRPLKVAMLYNQAEWKGADDGLEALRLAKEEVPELEARLFGVGRAPRKLPPWAHYDRRPSPSLLVEGIYNSSAVYLCPSWIEGWYLPGAEAMACGCALVTTDCGGVRDYSEHGETALMSPPRDPQRLAANLVRALRDDDLRASLSEAGYQAIQAFTWERATDELERTLKVADRH